MPHLATLASKLFATNVLEPTRESFNGLFLGPHCTFHGNQASIFCLIVLTARLTNKQTGPKNLGGGINDSSGSIYSQRFAALFDGY